MLRGEGHLADGADHLAHQAHDIGGPQQDSGESDRNGRRRRRLLVVVVVGRSGQKWTALHVH